MADILWISVEVPDKHGQGGQRRQYHQIRALRERGHDITVVVPNSPQSDVSLREIAPVKRPRVHIRGHVIPSLLANVRRRASDERWDAIIVAHQGSWWLLPEPERLSAPVLVDIHNVKSHWHRSRGEMAEADVALAEEDAAIRLATAISTCSDLERSKLLQEHPGAVGRAFTAPLGVDPAEWPDQTFSREEPIVALFGSWNWPPNVRGLSWFLENVWPQVHVEVPRAVAYVAGTGVDDSSPWPGGTRFVGRVPDLATWAAEATVLAVPVVGGVGASMKFAEALASGGAVIATTDGGSAFPDAPAFVSDDPLAWSDWIIERLQHRAEEPAPARSRAYALEKLTWSSAVSPIDDWLRRRQPTI